MRLLLIESDAKAAACVIDGFGKLGHIVDHVRSGREGLLRAGSRSFDVVILDRMLPGIDGLGIVRMLRSTDIGTPVIFLSAMSNVDERVAGLEAGADDYLIKPFAFRELWARVRALVRRPPLSSELPVLRVGDLELDRLKRTVRRGAKTIDLLPREFTLLEILMQRAGQIVTRTVLLERVWNYGFDPGTNIVETHVSRLRAKVDRGREHRLIRTVRGSGYYMRADNEIEFV